MNSTKSEKLVRFTLDPASGVPVYRQIIRQIEHSIVARKLEPGDKLPTIRSLAVELKINPNTIAKAYGELEIRGLVTTQVGSGTFISTKKPAMEEFERENLLLERTARFVHEMRSLGASRTEMIDLVRDFKED